MKSVFVIDDDSDVREVIVFALESEGFTVQSAEGALPALEILKEMPKEQYPGMLIVDYLMPEMDGIAFIKILKNEYRDTLGRIPIVFSSAMGTVDTTDPDLKDVTTLYKPMDLEDLLKVAHNHCD